MLEQDENHGKKRLNSFNSIFYTLIILIISALVLFFDNGPTLPPYGDKFDTIDCYNVQLQNFTDLGEFLEFNFTAGESIEYPVEYLPNFIYINIRSGFTKTQVTGGSMLNYSRDETSLKFQIPHQYGGPASIETYCLKNPATNNNYTLSDPICGEGLSCSDDPKEDILTFRNFCLENKKLLFFTNMYGSATNVTFDHINFEFEPIIFERAAFIKDQNITENKKSLYLISQMPEESWKTAMFWAAPLCLSLENHPSKDFQFITEEEPSALMNKTLLKITRTPPIKRDAIGCYSQFQMTRTMSSVDMNSDDDMNNIVHNYTALRKYFVNESVVSGIVIGEEIGDYYQEIHEQFPDQKLFMLRRNSNSLTEVADKCGNAKVLIGTHITSLAHSIWMKNNATIIDATPAEFSCNNWVSDIAKYNNLTYYRLFNSSNCSCSTFSCYPKEASSNININEIIEIIKRFI